MNETLCHHKGKFNYYNIQTGQFRFEKGLSLEGLQQQVLKDQGESGLRSLGSQVRRAKTFGTLRDLISFNSAGDGNKTLTLEECQEYFFT